MIATLRGLLVLAAIAIALAVVVITIGADDTRDIEDRRLPGSHLQSERSFVFTPVDGTSFSLAKTELSRRRREWRVRAGRSSYPADEATVDALLVALRSGKWHRRASRSTAGTLRGELAVSTGDDTMRIGIGAMLAGADQGWIVIGDHAFLVDGWVYRSLWPDMLDVRMRRPLAEAATAYRVWSTDVALVGRHQTKPTDRWISPSAFAALTRAYADVAFVAFDGTPGPRGRSLGVQTTFADDTRIELQEAGTCANGAVFVVSEAAGDGCVDRAAWDAAFTALEPFRLAGSEAVVDTRPVPFTPSQLTFATGEYLHLDGQPRFQDGTAVDIDRVNELRAALATPATIVPRPASSPTTTIVTADGNPNADDVTLEIYPSAVARKGESFALQPTPEALAVIQRPASALRSNVLWREDPVTLTRLVVDGVTYTRGAVLGEWTREPPGKVDAALVDALVETLASVKARPTKSPARAAHTLSVTFTPPTGSARTHELVLGAPAASGCPARVDGVGVQLDLALCTAAAALAAMR